jgi:hypothetical protein
MPLEELRDMGYIKVKDGVLYEVGMQNFLLQNIKQNGKQLKKLGDEFFTSDEFQKLVSDGEEYYDIFKLKGVEYPKLAKDKSVESQLIDIYKKATQSQSPKALPAKEGYIADSIKKAKASGQSFDEFIDSVPVKNTNLENAMSHRPSYDGMPPAHNLLQGDQLPRDVYTHPDYSISSGAIRRGEKAANESWSVLQKIKGKPNAEVTIYRASPKDELRNGDWITLSKEYAKQESLSEGVKVHSFKVKAKDIIFAGDDINEFGYWGHSTKDIDQLKAQWDKVQ